MNDYTMTKPKATFHFMHRAIRGNQLETVKKILYLNDTYFYKNGLSTNITRETCYVKEAIRQKNPDMLELLLQYGFAATIFREERKQGSNDDGYLFKDKRMTINPSNPFITDDSKLLRLLFQYQQDINKPYELLWTEKDGKTYTCYMTLLASALYFERMPVAKLLIQYGARLRFNLYEYMIEATSDSFGSGFSYMGPIYSNPLLSGYSPRKTDLIDLLDRQFQWAPIPIIFRKGSSKLIEWLMTHIGNDAGCMKEVELSFLSLRGKAFEKFIGSFPELLDRIPLSYILNANNYMALRSYLTRHRPKLNPVDIIEYADFNCISKRAMENMDTDLISYNLLSCMKEIIHYGTSICRNRKFRDSIFNLGLFYSYLGNMNPDLWNTLLNRQTGIQYVNGLPNEQDLDQEIANRVRSDECRRLAADWFKLYKIVSRDDLSRPDGTLFMGWYLTSSIRESGNNLKSIFKMSIKERPKLDIRIFDRVSSKSQQTMYYIGEGGKSITQSELSAIMDSFTPFIGDPNAGESSGRGEGAKSSKDLMGFYRIILEKNSIPLAKRMIARGYLFGEYRQAIIEYAVDAKSENIVPLLLYSKMEQSCRRTDTN